MLPASTSKPGIDILNPNANTQRSICATNSSARAGFLLDNLSNRDFASLEIPPVPDIDVVTEDAQQESRFSVEEEKEKEDAQATSTCSLGSVEAEGATLDHEQSEEGEEGAGPSIEEQKKMIKDSTNCLKEKLKAKELTLEQKHEILMELKKLTTKRKTLEFQVRKGKMSPDELLEWKKKEIN